MLLFIIIIIIHFNRCCRFMLTQTLWAHFFSKGDWDSLLLLCSAWMNNIFFSVVQTSSHWISPCKIDVTLSTIYLHVKQQGKQLDRISSLSQEITIKRVDYCVYLATFSFMVTHFGKKTIINSFLIRSQIPSPTGAARRHFMNRASYIQVDI